MPQVDKRNAGLNPHLLLERLVSTNTELEHFAHRCSHDLKEPLRGLSFLSGTLLEDYAPALPAEAQEKLERMRRLCDKLQKRITALLHYACIGGQDMEMESVNAADIVADAIEELFDTLAHNNAQVKVIGALPEIQCNRALVLSVFLNLIINAIKYNDRAEKQVGIMCLERMAHEERMYRNVFCISDNGIGIDRRYHAEVFNIFKRAHIDDAYGEGAGAGLTFVQRIVERHGGATWVSSTQGAGSQFYFTLEPAID